MMFSSSNINGEDSDCFGEHNYGFISLSSFQLGPSSSPTFLEEANQFFVTNYSALSQMEQLFLLGHNEGNPNYDHHLTLTCNHHDLAVGAIVAGSFHCNDNIYVAEEVNCAQKNSQTEVIGGSSNGEINAKDCQPLVKGSAKRIRTVKKDRHSKISTANGPRDRRMRLSLQIARKFFDLQDKLGFDKASKTIEWLLNMSKNAIREVMGNSSYHVDGSSGNISSDIGRKNHHVSPRFDQYEEDCQNNKQLKRLNKHCKSTKKKVRSTHTHVSKWPRVRKDVRDKARARARERTVEKMRLRALKESNQR